MKKPLTEEQKAARRASARARYAANPAKFAERNKAWRLANPENEAERGKSRRYTKEQKDATAKRSKEWATANPEKQAARVKSWAAANPAKVTMKAGRRRASRLLATPLWANEFIISEAYELAQMRTKVTGIVWHVDHVVPLTSKLVCGLHCEHNIRVIPGSENIAKNNRYWPDMPC